MKGLFKILVGAFISAIIGISPACYDQNMEELKEIPPVEYATDDRPANIVTKYTIGRHFLNQKGFNNVPLEVPADIKAFVWDARFRDVDYYWFLKFNKWFTKLKFENGIMPINPKENLDCDNFALLYKSLMGVSGYKSGEPQEPAVAVVVVRQIEEFGGIPATRQLHMVNLVMTRNGWFIYEPQTDKKILLEKYPNQKYIQYLIF